MRYWTGINPREVHVISRVGIIGLHVFEEDNRTVIINSERYVAIIGNFFQPSLCVLRENFPGRLISNRGLPQTESLQQPSCDTGSIKKSNTRNGIANIPVAMLERSLLLHRKAAALTPRDLRRSDVVEASEQHIIFGVSDPLSESKNLYLTEIRKGISLERYGVKAESVSLLCWKPPT
ncbi:hypothetical protein Trydic_g16776 [Trypoxylus dichotomus]